MNVTLPRYASAYRDRHGKQRIRLRRTGWPTLQVQHAPGTAEFTETYHQWLDHGRIEVGASKIVPGSFDDLIARFYRSKEWAQIKETTRYTYRGELERFRAKYGERSANTMTARHVANLINKMAATPSAANNLRKRLGQLFRFAIEMGWRTDNPAKSVAGLRIRSKGFATWQEEQIAQFEEHWAVGTVQRLAFDLALYTAQRRSDVRVMGPQHVAGGSIRVRQLKTDKELVIPMHPRLIESILATKTGHLAFVTSAKGAPFSTKSFGMWFAKQCRAAGLVGYSMHGLRKAASRRMAEAGLTNQEIKAITGHVTDSEVARYTREAEQVLIAKRAMKVMSLANLSNSDLAHLPQGTENA
ncbi:tyrosine-type recombinase/integrase [Novosphingobium fuchskuhlense]|uniref:tyrosine-type recombinase/integrase n=1 Tax=Novosphingobium fuchskuhlense TaxID=1117702 RepID=UPI0014700143|nr:tyrosine-type recombinase/integrase [Novosphingobium fuchskuhlense]